MEGSLSGQPTECRYCRYPAPNGRCHGNHFLAFDGLNFGCMITSETLFDSRGGFSGSSYPMKTYVLADFEVLRDIAMATILAFYIWGAHCATLRIRLNRPCAAAAMRPYVKLL